jgi:hypothetical protein
MATFYVLHVRRKTGESQTKFVIRQGNRPNPGELIDANLDGEKVEAQVMTKRQISKQGEEVNRLSRFMPTKSDASRNRSPDGIWAIQTSFGMVQLKLRHK